MPNHNNNNNNKNRIIKYSKFNRLFVDKESCRPDFSLSLSFFLLLLHLCSISHCCQSMNSPTNVHTTTPFAGDGILSLNSIAGKMILLSNVRPHKFMPPFFFRSFGSPDYYHIIISFFLMRNRTLKVTIRFILYAHLLLLLCSTSINCI